MSARFSAERCFRSDVRCSMPDVFPGIRWPLKATQPLGTSGAVFKQRGQACTSRMTGSRKLLVFGTVRGPLRIQNSP